MVMSAQTPVQPRPPLAARRRRVFGLLVATFTILLLSLVLEGGARIWRALAPAPEWAKSFGYPSGLFVWHETREYALRPGFSGFFAGRAYADIPIEINSDGYRDGPFQRADSSAITRVVFLGDSVTFGSGVHAESRFSDLLAQKAGGTKYESLNLGVNAYTFYHYLQQVREDVPKYDPEVVVIGFCLNDLAPKEISWPRNHVYLPDGTRLGAGPVAARWRAKAKELSAFVALLARAKNWVKRQAAGEAWQRWIRRVVKAWQDEQLVADLRRDLACARDELRRQKRRLLVLVLPEKNDLREPEQFGAPRQHLLSLLRELEIEYLDLYATFKAQPDTEELFLAEDSVHFTPRGHALVADTVGERLAE